jgi:hypothetical protein
MKTDAAIQQIRKARRGISAKCRHDPRALVAYYQAKEADYRDRLVKESATPYSTK